MRSWLKSRAARDRLHGKGVAMRQANIFPCFGGAAVLYLLRVLCVLRCG